MATPKTIRNRRPVDRYNTPPPEIIGWTAFAAGGTPEVTITTAEPVQLLSEPSFSEQYGSTLESWQQTGPKTILLTFDGIVGSGNSIGLNRYDSAIRTAAGGFLQPGPVVTTDSVSDDDTAATEGHEPEVNAAAEEERVPVPQLKAVTAKKKVRVRRKS